MHLGHYLAEPTHVSVRPCPYGDGLCAKESKRASEIAMRCRHLVYISTQYDDISCRWLVAKPIVRQFEVSSDIRTLQLARYYSFRLRIPVVSRLAHRVVALTYS